MKEDAFINLSHAVYENTDIDFSGTIVCDFVIKHLNGIGAAIYLYNRLSDEFEIQSFSGHANFPSETSPYSEKYHIYECYRNTLKCGLLCIDGGQHDKILAANTAKLLVILFNRKFTIDLLSRSSEPIDYLQDGDNFNNQLCKLAKESSQMPAGALRIIEGSLLTTIFHWNDWAKEKFENSDWDIDLYDESISPKFEECLNKNGAVITLGEKDVAHPFFSKPMQRGVKSAVFSPINVGQKTIGILSFAMPRDYAFSSVEKIGFLSLANSIGVSLTNFMRSATAELDLYDDVKIAQILTAVEIAQAARHSARADLDTLKTYILTAGRLLDGGLDRGGRQNVKEVLDECDTSIASCFKSLDDIKSAIRPPTKKLQKIAIRSLFEGAKSQIRGRSVKNNVDVKWSDRDIEIACYPDHLKQVFLNLLLNSVDAFSNLRRQGNRIVRARIHNYHENSDVVTIRFEDNAGGIDVAKLRQNADDHTSSVEELVFAKDVTTKGDEGSGWGLYVSRKVVRDHFGDINLLEYRGKTVFQIELKKEIEK